MAHKNQDDRKQYDRKRYLSNREKVKKQSRQRYINNLDAVKRRTATYYLEHRTTIVARKCQRRRELKIEVLTAYGGCYCQCGETRLGALTLDHINGGGKKHRNAIGGGSTTLYRQLKKLGFPDGYRVLCSNCNWLAHLNNQTLLDTASARYSRRHIAKLKSEAMALLGSQCANCAKNDIRILTIHHLNDDGAAHRNSISNGNGGVTFYRAILRTGDLKDLKCMCFSCNDNLEWVRRTERAQRVTEAPTPAHE